MKTIPELVQEYQSHVESITPDLMEGEYGEDYDRTELQDSIYDYACDYIHDREHNNADADSIRSAASIIAQNIA